MAVPTHLTAAPVSVLFVSSLEQSTAQWYVDEVELITPMPQTGQPFGPPQPPYPTASLTLRPTEACTFWRIDKVIRRRYN